MLNSLLLLVALASAAGEAAPQPSHKPWLDRCATARLLSSWKRDGLWRAAAVDGPHQEGHKIRYVGMLRAGSRTYKIYFDDNVDPPTHRGHKDLVVTTQGGKFLGTYNIIDTDSEPWRIEGSDILFPPRKDDQGRPYRDRIHFGPKGPPEHVPILFGWDVEFGTPAEFLKAFPHVKPWPEPGPRISAYCRR